METLYMALADKTRLRLLGLIYDGEVCVGDLTDALGLSQPKISRHLAYLRTAGVVETRRDGKWIHYKIKWPQDQGGVLTLRAALEWLGESNNRASEVISSNEKSVYPTARIDRYDNTDMFDERLEDDNERSAHNELEEFLL